MSPLMYNLSETSCPLWFNLVVAQFIAAIFFWSLDKWIFQEKKKAEIDAVSDLA